MKLHSLLITAVALAGLTTRAADFSLQETKGKHMDILSDGKIVGRYMLEHDPSTKESRDRTYKPYLHVFDAEGKAPITKGPGGEYTHHRGLFIGWAKISIDGKTCDRWHMSGGDIAHEKFSEQKADAKGATITSVTAWGPPAPGIPMIEEERTMTFLPPPAPAYAMIDFTSNIKAATGDLVLGGDPEHAGLQFRPTDEVDRALTKYLYPVPNADPHKDRDYPWVAQTFTIKGGKTYSVVYLNHPSNVKDAAISAYRNYGRFGMFFKGPVKKGEVLTAKVRVIVKEGDMPEADWIQKQANAFTGGSDPTPQTTAKAAEGAKSKAAPKAPAKPDEKTGK